MMDERWDISPMKSDAALHLDLAEAALFKKLCSEVEAGEYDRAETVIHMLQELSLV